MSADIPSTSLDSRTLCALGKAADILDNINKTLPDYLWIGVVEICQEAGDGFPDTESIGRIIHGEFDEFVFELYHTPKRIER